MTRRATAGATAAAFALTVLAATTPAQQAHVAHVVTTPASRTQVVLLGTGTPRPDPERSGPATAIVVNDTAYLVDAGPGIVRRAQAAFEKGIKGLAVASLQTAFLTHLHSQSHGRLAGPHLYVMGAGAPRPVEAVRAVGHRIHGEIHPSRLAERHRDPNPGTRAARPCRRHRRGSRRQARDHLPGCQCEGDRVRGKARRHPCVRIPARDGQSNHRHHGRHQSEPRGRRQLPEVRRPDSRSLRGGLPPGGHGVVAGVPGEAPHDDGPARRAGRQGGARPAHRVSPRHRSGRTPRSPTGSTWPRSSARIAAGSRSARTSTSSETALPRPARSC